MHRQPVGDSPSGPNVDLVSGQTRFNETTLWLSYAGCFELGALFHFSLFVYSRLDKAASGNVADDDGAG